MSNNNLSIKKQYLIENYDKLKNEYKWKVEQRMLLILASQYAGNQKMVEIDSLKNIDAMLKEEVGFFTSLDSVVRRCLAVLFDTTVGNSNEAIQTWRKNYDLLVEKKFARGIFTYITAYQLLFIPDHEKEQVVMKALAIYKALRKQHFFLTGEEDYPAVMMLGTLKKPVETILETISSYYKGLGSRGFSKGNDLQFLTNILTFSEEKPEEVIKRVIRIKNQFEEARIKVRRNDYSSMGILGLMNIKEVEVQSIIRLIKELQDERVLRWKKDLAMSLGIDLFVKNQIKDNSLIDTGLMVVMQTVIQAQQTAMIAASMVAISSSSSSSNSC